MTNTSKIQDSDCPVNQSVLLKKMREFLSTHNRRENDTLVKKLGSGGHCSGLAVLWLYTKWLQTQAKPSEQSLRDDNDWFKKTVKIIATYDEDKYKEDPLAVEEVKRFIEYIEFFQNPNDYIASEQQTSPNLFQNVTEICKITNEEKKISYVCKPRSGRQEYSIAAILDLKQLETLLNENFIPTNKLVYIKSCKHATALFKNQDESYSYFDSNSTDGEFRTSSINKLAEHIFSAHRLSNTGNDGGVQMPFTFSIFALDEIKSIYEKEQDILEHVNPLSMFDTYTENKASMLHLAASVNSIGSAEYCLKKGIDVNMCNKSGETALMIAAQYGYTDFIKLLISQRRDDIDIYCKNGSGETALIKAIQMERLEAVKLLLYQDNIKKVETQSGEEEEKLPKSYVQMLDKARKYNFDSEIYQKYIKDMLICAAKVGNVEIFKIVLEKAREDLSGGYLKTQAENERYALIEAAQNGQADVFKYLLEQAKDNLTGECIKKAFDVAIKEEKDIREQNFHLNQIKSGKPFSKEDEKEVLRIRLTDTSKTANFRIIKIILESGKIDNLLSDEDRNKIITLANERGYGGFFDKELYGHAYQPKKQ